MWIQLLSCPETSYRNHFRVKAKVFTRTCRDDVDGHWVTSCGLLAPLWPHQPLCASRVCQKSSQLGIVACVGLYVWNDLPQDICMACSLDFLKSLHKWYLLTQIFPDLSILNTSHLLSVLYFLMLEHFSSLSHEKLFHYYDSLCTTRQAAPHRLTNWIKMIESHGLLNQLKLTLGE